MKTTIDKEFFEKWRDKKVVMHCKTEEEAIEFCRLMNENGLKWSSGDSYLDFTFWEQVYYKRDICYSFNSGEWNNVQNCKNKGYTILEFSDYIIDEETATDNAGINGTCRTWEEDEYGHWEL